VFLGDHGAPIDATYDMSLSYNHIPLLFYAPAIIKDYKVFDSMAGQIDVFPSIMGLLDISYKNNTLGINLFKEKRPYIFCNADDKYGVLDNDWFLIVRNDKSKGLYKYRDKSTKNYAAVMPDKVKEMQVYAESNLQSSQYVINEKKQ
jgi:phosphoglycerol transferase MdoB-like AlkP superfamily enzyme